MSQAGIGRRTARRLPGSPCGRRVVRGPLGRPVDCSPDGTATGGSPSVPCTAARRATRPSGASFLVHVGPGELDLGTTVLHSKLDSRGLSNLPRFSLKFRPPSPMLAIPASLTRTNPCPLPGTSSRGSIASKSMQSFSHRRSAPRRRHFFSRVPLPPMSLDRPPRACAA